VATISAKDNFWKREHHLDRMTLRQLIVAYFQYPAIIAYLGGAAIAAGVFVYRPATIAQTAGSIVTAILLFPIVWYMLHRWVLHGSWMYKIKPLAGTWKRIHYDHHQNPNHLEVLFGGLHTTLPTVAIATIPVGYAIGGIGGAAAAFGTGMIQTAVNEFCHCIQHLNYTPKNKWLLAMKTRHMAHHFHDESGNFGITNFWWDRLGRTFYARVADRKKSPTVFNLGYTPEVAKSWPKVAELSGGVATGHPSTRIKG
jgi:sterol desaturase/sphingolipid hydroxylase (fatty acid hydroxylase superfamily)